jgi:thymidylate synthase
MNKLDKQYTDLLQDILDNGVEKKDRTGTGTLSVFGRQIRHNMSEGFPLLTTKKMHWKSIVTELLWFLRGDTHIKYLVDNGCHVWDGDAYKNYLIEDAKILPNMSKEKMTELGYGLSKEEFINKIKTDDEFAKKWGELGPIYGKQWRSWRQSEGKLTTENGIDWKHISEKNIDQIANLINDLKTNPDSRRLMVNAWNVGELDSMTLPPCHYGFQVYTRELSRDERIDLYCKEYTNGIRGKYEPPFDDFIDAKLATRNIPTRAISLMWNQRSVDTGLGLPFNIASYGLLLMMIADEVNMVPDELIGNLGDVHLYTNHIEQAKEQIGRDLTLEERMDWWFDNHKPNRDVCDSVDELSPYAKGVYFDEARVPKYTREPYPLPKVSVRDGIYCSSVNDVILENYQSHSTIKMPLSN